jgi:hypothetical protein
MTAGFAAPAGPVSTQQQTMLVQTHSLSSGSSTSSVHGAPYAPSQGLGSCAAVTVSTSTGLKPQQGQLLCEEGSFGAKFSSLGAYSSSGGSSACASQYSIWGPVGQQQQHEAMTAVQGPCSSDTSLTGWTAALQPSSSSPGLGPGAVYADQDHPVMQVAAAGSAGYRQCKVSAVLDSTKLLLCRWCQRPAQGYLQGSMFTVLGQTTL